MKAPVQGALTHVYTTLGTTTSTSIAVSATMAAPSVIYGLTQGDYGGAIGIGIGIAVAGRGGMTVGAQGASGPAARDLNSELGLELMDGSQFGRKYGIDGAVFAGYEPGGISLARFNASDLLDEAVRLGRDFSQLRATSDSFGLMNRADSEMLTRGYGGRVYSLRLDYGSPSAGHGISVPGNVLGAAFPTSQDAGVIGAPWNRSMWLLRSVPHPSGLPSLGSIITAPEQIGLTKPIYLHARM